MYKPIKVQDIVLDFSEGDPSSSLIINRSRLFYKENSAQIIGSLLDSLCLHADDIKEITSYSRLVSTKEARLFIYDVNDLTRSWDDPKEALCAVVIEGAICQSELGTCPVTSKR